MTTTQVQKAWDFTQVHELINTLNANNPFPRRDAPATDFFLHSSLPNDSPLSSPALNKSQGGVSLGNFSKVWDFLGAPEGPSAARPLNDTTSYENTSPTLQHRVPIKTDYTSDGAVYLTPHKTASKSIQWRDEANGGGELTDVAPSPESEKLSKTQRKKKNRQERRRLAEEGHGPSVSDFESEADETPAHKASSHSVSHAVAAAASTAAAAEPTTPQRKYNLRARDSFGKPLTTWVAPTTTPAPRSLSPVAPYAKQIKTPESFFQKRDRSRSPAKRSLKDAPSTPVPARITRHESQPLPIPHATPATTGKDGRTKSSNLNNLSPSYGSPSASMLPASVQPPRHRLAEAVPSHPFPKLGGGPENTLPKTFRTGEDRDWALLLKIIRDFYEDRASLLKPANLTNHATHPNGIHVFVDASNIFIGFMDQLKRARGLSQHDYLPRVYPSFDALALLMERRRPIAKRVLVGSNPHLAAFDTAREIGYECNILDKVLKARELTDRQIYFKQQEEKKKKYGKGQTRCRSGSDSGGNDSSTPSGPVFAREAMVEQGVDEIIHLKMMESIVDTEAPSTMVLATGDAAQAEYSQGFMKMTERALKAGWKVELVSWSKNISQAYKKADFRRLWGDKFKIVELDDYAEELCDM